MDKGPHEGIIQPGIWGDPIFGTIQYWHVTEKIDGTNVTIELDLGNKTIEFWGHHTKSIMQPQLLEFLKREFKYENLCQFFDPSKARTVYLQGEGYGPGVQHKIGQCPYGDQIGFVMFDIVIDGVWLQQDTVHQMAYMMNIPTVPEIGIMTKDEIHKFIESEPFSRFAVDHNPKVRVYEDKTPLPVMEGIVARSDPLVCHRIPPHDPIMFKLKGRDLRELKLHPW
jgi:hypothetical protein